MTGHRIEAVVDSTVAKGITRFVVPLLLTAIGALGMLAYNAIKTDIAGVAGAQAKQGESISQIKSDVRDVNTRLDAGLIRQVDSQGKHLDNLEQRVQTIERVVRTP